MVLNEYTTQSQTNDGEWHNQYSFENLITVLWAWRWNRIVKLYYSYSTSCVPWVAMNQWPPINDCYFTHWQVIKWCSAYTLILIKGLIMCSWLFESFRILWFFIHCEMGIVRLTVRTSHLIECRINIFQFCCNTQWNEVLSVLSSHGYAKVHELLSHALLSFMLQCLFLCQLIHIKQWFLQIVLLIAAESFLYADLL